MPMPQSCPPAAELEQFLLGQLDDTVWETVEAHFSACTTCQQRAEALTVEDDFVRAMRPAGGDRPAEEIVTLLCEAPDDLVNLLIPHFKRLPNGLQETASLATNMSAAGTTKLGSLSTGLVFQGSAIPEPLRQLGRYEIRGVLGRGGMGLVLNAFDPLLHRSVAIKVVQTALLADPRMAEGLLREAQAAAAVEHDNIVAIYAVETLEGAPCISMPLLRGMTLAQHLDQVAGPLPLVEILRIGREATSGLAAAHERGLIHRDIKPANLWLEEPLGRVKILDFGLAIDGGDHKRGSGEISGTPGYLAPEQARGLPVDQRTDLFSLGCVLYRMATGNPPFTGEHRMRVLWTVLGDPPARASQINPQVPEELDELIHRLLSRDPENRPASASMVLECLESVDRRLTAQQHGVIRRRWIAALIGVAVLSGSSVGLWALATAPRVMRPVQVTILGDEPALSVLLTHDGDEQPLSLGAAQTLDLMPGDYFARPASPLAGRTLVPERFSVEEERPQTVQMALVGEVARHATHTLPVTGVALVPESNPPTVLSVGLDRTLIRWDSASVVPPRFANLPHSARCVAVSPSGASVAVAGGNKQPPAELSVQIWDADRLVPQGKPHAGHSRLVFALAYSPDGTQLASGGGDGVFLWNLTSGESQRVASAEMPPVLALAFSRDGRRLLTGSDDGSVILWDASARTRLKTWTAGTQAVRAVAFVGGDIAAAGDDGVIRVWEESAVDPREFTSAGCAVLALVISQDGSRMLSGDADGTIRVWSTSLGQTIQVLNGHSRAVQALAISSNGRQAVSGGADGTVRLWQLPFP